MQPQAVATYFLWLILFVPPNIGAASVPAGALPTAKPAIAARQASKADAALAQKIDATARAVMRKHAIPGLAIVFVKDGKITYEKGFGVTAVIGGTPVRSDTLFRVGSISKSITAVAVALLAQQHKLHFHDALGDHIPELAAAHPDVARLTIRQILAHQTQLDLDRLEPLLWPQPNDFKFENIVSGLKVLAEDARNTGLSGHPRKGAFSYSNMNYALAGEVVRRVSSVSYGTFVQREIFKPLVMNCIVFEGEVSRVKSVAQPHMRMVGVVQSVRTDAPNEALAEGLEAAAGGVRCDANAMAKWVQFQLNPKASGLDIVEPIWRDLHSAQAAVRTDFDQNGKPTAIETYALGLQVTMDSNGIRYDHYGGVAGMLSYFAASPAHNSGFAILLNLSDGAARKAIIDGLLPLMVGKPMPKLVRTAAPAIMQTPPKVEKIKIAAAPVPAPAANANATSITPYFGRYEDAWFGQVTICPSANRVVFKSLKSRLFQGELVAGEDGVTLFWDDKAINSDSILRLKASKRPDAEPIQGFILVPLGESDFDFSAMHFRRIGECP